MGYTSLINGHIDEPTNGVYCWQCKYAKFDEAGCRGICEAGRMGVIVRNSYCNRGDNNENEETMRHE